MSTSITEYFSKLAQKRKPSSTSSSESSSVNEKNKQDKKILFHEMSDSYEEERENEMSVKTTRDEIITQFQTRATKADILQLKSDVDKLTSQFMLRLDKLERRSFDAKKGIDSLKNDIASMKKRKRRDE